MAAEVGVGGLGQVMTASEFSIKSGLGNTNLFEMVRYFETSKILPKLHGYYERRRQVRGVWGVGCVLRCGDGFVSCIFKDVRLDVCYVCRV